MMIGGPRAVESGRHRQRLLALVLADPHARATWAAWDATSDPGPTGPSLRLAERAHENDDGSGRMSELVLQRWIADELAKGWGYREARPSDGLPIPPSRHLAGAGYPDLLLVHPDRARTIVVVEVKRAARPGPTTDGVTQLDEAYVPWLEDRLKGWNVVSWLIALHFSPEVLRRAHDLGIECWRIDPDDREFYEPEDGS
jgi:hypothetical protein